MGGLDPRMLLDRGTQSYSLISDCSPISPNNGATVRCKVCLCTHSVTRLAKEKYGVTDGRHIGIHYRRILRTKAFASGVNKHIKPCPSTLASVSRPALGPTQPPVQWVPGVLSPGVKRGWGVTLTTHPHLVPRS
jgi:hypothetical protein